MTEAESPDTRDDGFDGLDDGIGDDAAHADVDADDRIVAREIFGALDGDRDAALINLIAQNTDAYRASLGRSSLNQ